MNPARNKVRKKEGKSSCNE